MSNCPQYYAVVACNITGNCPQYYAVVAPKITGSILFSQISGKLNACANNVYPVLPPPLKRLCTRLGTMVLREELCTKCVPSLYYYQ